MKAISRPRCGAVLVAGFYFIILLGAATASAQTLYSFESTSPVLDGWTAANATLVPSTTFGVTDGAKSMLIDNSTSGFKNDVGFIGSRAVPATVFNNLNDAALAIEAGKTNVKLEFDFSWDLTNVTGPANYAQLGMFVNSTGANFKQYGTGELLGGNVGTGVTVLFPKAGPAAVSDGVALTSIGAQHASPRYPAGTD